MNKVRKCRCKQATTGHRHSDNNRAIQILAPSALHSFNVSVSYVSSRTSVMLIKTNRSKLISISVYIYRYLCHIYIYRRQYLKCKSIDFFFRFLFFLCFVYCIYFNFNIIYQWCTVVLAYWCHIAKATSTFPSTSVNFACLH